MRFTNLLCLPLALLSTACLWGGSDNDEMNHDAMMTADHDESVAVESTSQTDVRDANTSPLFGWSAYGAPIASKNRLLDTVSFQTVAENVETYDGQQIRMTGIIEEVCQKKGCWMTMTEGDEMVRVTFKDYGFFVPFDASGKQVIVDGTFQVEMMEADIARHYLEDAGKHDEAAAITGDVESLTFVATSVLIQDHK